VRLTTWKSWSLNLLEPSGPHRACYRTALHFCLLLHSYIDSISRLLKQIWLFPYLHGFCNPVRIHVMKINDMIWLSAVTDISYYLPVDTAWHLRGRDHPAHVTVNTHAHVFHRPTEHTFLFLLLVIYVSYCLCKYPCFCDRQ